MALLAGQLALAKSKMEPLDLTQPGMKEKYSKWDSVYRSTYPGYDYDVYEVTAEDGYITTGMRFNAPGQEEPRGKPILLQSGAMTNILSWWPKHVTKEEKADEVIANFSYDMGDGKFRAKLDWLSAEDPDLFDKLMQDEATKMLYESSASNLDEEG